MIMLAHNRLRSFATRGVFREESAFLEFRKGDVEPGAGDVCYADLGCVSYISTANFCSHNQKVVWKRRKEGGKRKKGDIP